MSTPLVSILIPALNVERWIGQTLASCLAQRWPSIEVIVADGGSHDRTRAIVTRMASPKIRLISPSQGGGSAAANRNRALREAQGEYIQYLDADDLLSSDKIERQMQRLLNEPGCVASAEWARFVDAPTEARFVPEPVWADMEPTDWLVRAWTGGGGMMQPGLWLIPRPVVDQAGPWDERLTLIDDFEYFTRVVLACRGVRFCRGARLYYRSGNPTSLASLRSDAAWRSALLSLERGTAALLGRCSTPQARRACADLFQRLAYEAYGEHVDVSGAAERRALALGGSSVVMDGGPAFRALSRTLGWRRAKQLKRAAYAAGYGAVVARAPGRTPE